ncbi:MAG: putative metal-binding motif-containing protein [Myxococcota bacterium]
MRALPVAFLLALFTACGGGDDDEIVEDLDQDGDGVVGSLDCDDTDSSTFPGAPEVCDGIDNNCDGTADEELQREHFADQDGDGFGDPSSAQLGCEVPAGRVEDGTDCDDSSPLVSPGAPEVCDGIDNDCDASTTEAGLASVFDPTDGSFAQDISTELATPSPGLFSGAPALLQVCDGTFYPNFAIGADFDLVGIGDVILDGNDERRMFVIDGEAGTAGARLSLTNVTLTGGSAPDVTVYGDGGFRFELGAAVLCRGEDNYVALDQVLVEGNSAQGGAVAIIEGCDAGIVNSEFTDNVGDFANSIYAFGSLVDIDETHIHANLNEGLYGGAGGAVYASVRGQIVLNNSIVEQPDGAAVVLFNNDANTAPTLTCNGTSSVGAGLLRSKWGVLVDSSHPVRGDFVACDLQGNTVDIFRPASTNVTLNRRDVSGYFTEWESSLY